MFAISSTHVEDFLYFSKRMFALVFDDSEIDHLIWYAAYFIDYLDIHWILTIFWLVLDIQCDLLGGNTRQMSVCFHRDKYSTM